ncbi:uncharacterized protein A4U43_C01F17870, partial [Asparagus officinalis]
MKPRRLKGHNAAATCCIAAALAPGRSWLRPAGRLHVLVAISDAKMSSFTIGRAKEQSPLSVQS